MRNLHKFYYKDYFEGLDFRDIKKIDISNKNRDLVQEVIDNNLFHTSVDCSHTVEMDVLYPGLITGIGIQHEAGIEKEMKLGLHFDYTYGYPIIYGSSVKGVLNSYFNDVYEKDNVDKVVSDIFEGIDFNNNPKSIYDRDIFYDAVIIKSNDQNKLLDTDALAPHGGATHTNPFEEPVPISFVKVAPGVSFLFRFDLKPTKDANGNEILTPDDKLDLFIKILTTFGIGAKTNVGYGQLDLAPEFKQERNISQGRRIYEQANRAFETGNYEKALDLYTKAMEFFNANSNENLVCRTRIAESHDNIFNQLIKQGDNLVEQGNNLRETCWDDADSAYNEAKSAYDEAKKYAETKKIYSNDKIDIYNMKISNPNLNLKWRPPVQQGIGDTTFSDHISDVNKIGTLVGKVEKWIREGRTIGDDEKGILRDKIKQLENGLNKREIKDFNKGVAKLQKWL